ncbi:MAG: sigma-70 family RNA polymerase sigma factor [Planctomycetes bacterium]|nr:sigma-70 family RNA polymerase sigma factor [Planctomycetota bacterium]MCB9872113.1 sigma-70 family RNA polymerase sigma factor [Planctomycetota bacterium]
MADSRKLFEALIHENAHSLRIFLHSLVHDPSLVDDLFQETMVIAWRTLDRFDQERSFGRWVRGIARNVVLTHRRRDARQLVVAREDLVDLIDDHCESIQRMSNDFLDDRLDRLRRCIDSLPTTYREAIRLRYQRELKGQRLATQLQTSWDNVKKRLQRGRKILFECMEGKWSAPRGAEV